MRDIAIDDANQIDALDLAKFALSIFVVAIHCNLGGVWRESPLYPWLRLAVPLFFLMTSYLFFCGYIKASDPEKRKERVFRFVARNLRLYFFWLVVLLVPTIRARGYFSSGLIHGLFRFTGGLLLGSTFPASWYIMSSVIAVVIVVLLSKMISARQLMILSLACYATACAASNYGNIRFFTGATLSALINRFLGHPYCNFVVAIFWVVLGKLIAENKTRIDEFRSRHSTFIPAAIIVSLAVLYAEQRLVLALNLSVANDCYLLLPVPTTLLFIELINARISIAHGSILRRISTITYCFHGTCSNEVRTACSSVGFFDYGLLEFAIVLGTSWLVSFFILRAVETGRFEFLRNAY